jgi:E3 ubiquitin-protein ligase HECTD1
MINLSSDERKAFLQFTTGCSSLPPGGLANLHPRLTIVRKVDGNDNSFPSVNTCVHYLKLPEYSSEDILREKLLAATSEKGFHLN